MRFDQKVLRPYVAAVLVGLTLALPAGAQDVSRDDAAKRVSAAASSVRIDNFGRINEGYYRGAQPKGSDYADLQALGVRTVIDLTGMAMKMKRGSSKPRV